MALTGRPPKPTDQRHTYYKRPEIGPLEAPKPDGRVVPLVPKAPKGLSAASRRRWAAYWSSPVAQAADQNADQHQLERWIWATDEYDRVSVVFRKTRLVKGSTGQPVLNPLAAYLQQLSQEIGRAEMHLGLTPAARLRLGIAYGEAKLTALELNRALDEAAERERLADPSLALLDDGVGMNGDGEDVEWQEA